MKTAIIGAGGHARIVYEILQADHNVEVSAFVDNTPRGTDEEIMGVPVLGPHSVVPELVEDGLDGFIVAVGDNEIRSDHFEKFLDMGLTPVSAVHSNANVSPSASLGRGVVLQSGTEVTTNATIGDNTIINTGVIVEHEVSIGDHAHIGPGSAVAGRAEIGDQVFVGMGCMIKEYLTLGTNAVVGAGSVVLEDVTSDTMVAGSPAQVKKPKE